MCTVVYIPTQETILFASLRDESPTRPKAIVPTFFSSPETNYLAPTDALAGGTWLGAGQYNTIVILLNGAFDKHVRNEPYRKSRGLIVSEMLASVSPLQIWNNLDLNRIEPFTLIVWENKTLVQLVWDGAYKHLENLDTTQAHIWSSSTLYTAEAKQRRQMWFEDWLKTKPNFSMEALLDFFKSVSDSNNGFLMNRENKVKTLSYTFLEVQKSDSLVMNYHDFATNSFFSEMLDLVKPLSKSV